MYSVLALGRYSKRFQHGSKMGSRAKAALNNFVGFLMIPYAAAPCKKEEAMSPAAQAVTVDVRDSESGLS